MIKTITILGSGNVSWHLSQKLVAEGVVVECVFGRNKQSGSELASVLKTRFTDKITDLPQNSDAYLFMMSDAGNKEIAEVFPLIDKLLIHTSGSLDYEIFAGKSKNIAVVYPFQTFTKNVEVADFSEIPMCIDSPNENVMIEVENLAKKISPKVYRLGFEQRRILHISGVFAANFMNHTVFLGQKLLQENNIPTEILTPLLQQSFSKILSKDAFSSQTGPASRGDLAVVEAHEKLLADKKLLLAIYALMSESILKTYTNE